MTAARLRGARPGDGVLVELRPPAGRTRPPTEFEASRPGDDRSWQDHANCLGVDPTLFFPGRGESADEAKEVCHGCSVLEECLEHALARPEKFGIWGGTSERERRRLRRARNLARRREGQVS